MRFSTLLLRLRQALALGGCCALLSSAQAANFHLIGEIGTNMTDGNPGGNPLSNVIQGPGAGFSATEPHDGPSDTWYTDAPGGFPSDYVEVHAGPEYLWFDLGANVAVSEISYWGYATTNANGVKDFNLSFATADEGGAVGLGDEDYATSIAANPSFAATIDNVARQSFTFNPVVARYVRVEVTSTHITNGGNGPPAGGDRVGIGEIAFESVVISPDPVIAVEENIALELTSARDVFDIPIGNAGNSELTISGTNFIGPNAAAFSVASVPATIAALSSDIIEVQFDPAGLLGPVTATLQISSNDPATPVAEIVFTGTVPPTEQDIVVPGPVDRGSIAIIDTFDLLISNGGDTVLNIVGTNFTGTDAAAFSVTNAPATIGALGSENIQVQIDPVGLDGPITATLQIMSDDPDTPTAEVVISANALGDAGQFYPISSVESSTGAGDLWPVSNLIQGPGVGFDAAQPHDRTSTGAGGLWVTGAPGGFPSDFIEADGMPVLTFDLGQDVPLCEISIWGYSATNSNGLSEFSLRFATEADGPAGFGTSIEFNPSFAGIDSGELPNEDDTSRFSFLLGQQVTARYVEFTCVDNHFIAPGNGSGGEIPGGDRVGIGEVAFEITTCETPTLFLDVSADGDNLVLTWESVDGLLYNVRSETDPASATPPNWPLFGVHSGIVATPPFNTLTIPRPADPFRLFVVEAFPVPPVELYADDFESGQGGWTVGNEGNAGTDWALGTPTAVGPAAANSPVNCFGTNLAARYEILANVWLRSPVIDLSGFEEATLVYSQFVDIEENFDIGTVSVLDAADNVLAVLAPTVDGTTADWQEVRHSLPPEAVDQPIKIEFRLVSDDFVDKLVYAGFYIDDVQVTAR